MNKKIYAALFALCLLGLLAGCSKKENTNEEQGTSPSFGSKASAGCGADRSLHRCQRQRHRDLWRSQLPRARKLT